MLSRLLARAPNLRYLTLISSNKPQPSLEFANVFHTFRCFSSDRNNNNNGGKFNNNNKDPWKLTPDDDEDSSSIFRDLTGGGIPRVDDDLGKGGRIGSTPNAPLDSWGDDFSKSSDVFDGIGKEFEAKKNGGSWGDESFGTSDGLGEGKIGGRPSAPVESWADDFGGIEKKFESKSGGGRIGSSDVNVDLLGDESLGVSDNDAKKSIIGEGGGADWETAEGYKDWSFEEDEKTDFFDMGGVSGELPGIEDEYPERGKSESDLQLEQLQKTEKEEKELSAQLNGPNRAFGDLIAASGITDAMLDSLIVLKDLEGVEGLPPLHEIEDIRFEKAMAKNTRADLERQKQEEIAKSRVRRVDDKGRAYGTGRRKCSVARVFIQPGEGQFLVNDKQFDAYFPILDHRATLLSPFSETKTLGLWDIKCTVKGGGVSGQVGAIRLGISRALQNWEPGLHTDLRAAGFLTRDPRAVERKKPGKAKARKSFQWVKR